MSDKSNNLRPEYPTALIRAGVRGKYAQRWRDEGTNIAVIDPDLHKEFPDSEAVNRALRDYLHKRQGSES